METGQVQKRKIKKTLGRTAKISYRGAVGSSYAVNVLSAKKSIARKLGRCKNFQISQRNYFTWTDREISLRPPHTNTPLMTLTNVLKHVVAHAATHSNGLQYKHCASCFYRVKNSECIHSSEGVKVKLNREFQTRLF